MNIIILGPQGSGKGTQAYLIAEKYGLKHLSTGDVIRAEIKDGNTELKEILAAGKLVSNDIVIELLKQNLGEGNIFDGFPRNLEQAHELDDITQIDLVIALELTDESAVERLSQRRQCKNCSAVYGPAKPPQKEGKCDNDGGELYQRDDDKPEVIKDRLAIYRDSTEPLLEYYKPRDIMYRVDGSKSIEEVFKDLCDIIEKAGL